jgi:RNA polymerase sigma factor (sigma-70 family)
MAIRFHYLRALSEGNSKKIEEIYKNNFPNVKKFILNNKGQKEDVEDVFQKALIQISVRFRKEEFEITTSFEAYLFTVCKNIWRRELNKKKKVTEGKVIELISEERNPSIALNELKRQELFIEKLNSLSENCKLILNFYFSKISYAEMIKLTDYSSETVIRQRVFKCKKQLTDQIKKDKRYIELK